MNSVYVAITVIDVNDHPPKFEQEVYYVNVKETKPIGEVIIDVTATDEDKGLRLFYFHDSHTLLVRFSLLIWNTFAKDYLRVRPEKYENVICYWLLSCGLLARILQNNV